ncbi:MAG: PEGA domain-containing protein [Methanoregulaceae archaeon]|nr:MAG: PEGA domain-containing protein [Methanoregulaceae archaeon]
MKGSIFPVGLVFLFFLAIAGIPAAASPAITDIRPVSAPNNGDITVTITGTGFNSQSTVWMKTCDGSSTLYGTVISWSPTSLTCIFSFYNQNPGTYNVWVNSPFTSSSGNYYPEDVAVRAKGFAIYQGTGTTYAIIPSAVTTSYGPQGPYGTIYVESSPPGAIVSVNGENRGHAPVTIKGLYPGSYTISAELSGYTKYTTTTSISGAEYSSVYCPLVRETTGTGLYVTSTPARASVYLEGVFKGVTPLMLSDTAAGSHILQVRLSGYDEWKSTVDVPTGGTRTITAILIQNNAGLINGINVSSNPSGANVLLDGLKKGFTPITLNKIAAGIHILEIEYPGYITWKSTVDVPESGIKDISVTLTTKSTSSPGWITVFSRPDNASVTLNGIYVGRTLENTSLNLDAIPAGEHTVALELPGYQPYSTQVSVSPNQVSAVNVTFTPSFGAVSVTSDPAGATIFLDNASIGISPVTAGNVSAGSHLVTMQREGYLDYSASILVTAGTTSSVSAALLPVTPALHSPALPLTVFGSLFLFGFFFLRKSV